MKSFKHIPLPAELEEWRVKIEAWAREYGLDFYQTIFEVLDWEQMNMVASYGGFPNRYPHWRFGMEYEQMSKSYAYGLSKIYELVINNDPCYAYLLHCNKLVDQKMVMAHVFAHCDFFKNNVFFAPTPKNMMDQMANHKTRVLRYIDRLGFDRVESFLDTCLSLENLIDYQKPHVKPKSVVEVSEDDPTDDAVHKLRVDKEYLEEFINPQAFLDLQKQKQVESEEKRRRIPHEPDRDIMGFLLEHAPISRWEYDILNIIRTEAYYFAPQAQTKIMNEGWACVVADTPVYTESGLISMQDLVNKKSGYVCDGKKTQKVYDRHIIRNHDVIAVTTRRGFELCGSNNHRILLADGKTWKRLDEFVTGDSVAVSGGHNLWPQIPVVVKWVEPTRISLNDVADQAGVSIDTVLRHRAGQRVRAAEAVALFVDAYEASENLALPMSLVKRKKIRVPHIVDEDFGSFLGYLIGDGHISRVKRHLGLTSADHEQIDHFLRLSQTLFDCPGQSVWDDGRYRARIHSEMLSDFLIQEFGLTHGPSAREKKVPQAILESPEKVVAAFIRAYFDCDAYAGKQGVILSSSSRDLVRQVQLLLLNFNILSRVRHQKSDDCWHLHIVGQSAKIYLEKIGFGLKRKQQKLSDYVKQRKWFKTEDWSDEIVEIKIGKADVYDISVEETHRYAAGGLINHNSYWHSTIMTQKALDASEIIDFAENHSGAMVMGQRLNPYKIGIELFRDIEERWNKGQYGKEYNECDDMVLKQKWDQKLGGGRKKIFDVRKIYNDVTFIDEFFTADFCRRYNLFAYQYNPMTHRLEISDRDFAGIKKMLLTQLTNFGQPIIAVVDANFGNRGELKLRHTHEGVDLDIEYARQTLKSLYEIWKRPVLIETILGDKTKIFTFDGEEHKILDSKEGV